jgi:thiol:disulfide interchange protein DsbD
MALGMGVPLMAVGLSAGALLPRAGAWMEGVRRAFGVLLLATALWLVAPVLPSVVVMLLAAALLIIPAIYLHALDPLPPPARGWAKFWKGVGIVMLLTGAALLLGALGGSRDLLQPLAGSRGAQAAGETPGLPFVRVASLAELDARLKQPGKPVLLDFYADWCVSCKEMERFTFTDPAVRARLGDFLLLQADVTGNRPEDQALLQRFQLFGPPGIVFFDPEGRELPEPRLVGFADAPTFLALLERVPRR